MTHTRLASDNVDWGSINSLCAEFEVALRRGERLLLSNVLVRAEAKDQPALLYELLRIELAIRQSWGETCSLNDYLSELPTHEVIVRVAFIENSKSWGDCSPTDSCALGDPLTLPAQFGDYELLELIGQGAMGVVYKVWKKRPTRVTVVKLLRRDRLARRAGEASAVYLRRFYQEAILAAKLNHPFIAPIYDVGDEGGQPYIAMAYVPGVSLAKRLEEGPLPGRDAAGLLRSAALAIAYAHQCGVVHRDIKPRNILLDERGALCITDLGIARDTSGVDLSATELPNGIAQYMSPEQASGNRVDPASDIYGLGATLYELLTGRPPFCATSNAQTLRMVLSTEPVAPRDLNPTIPRDIETICLKCLDKDPTRRYGTAGELAEDVTRFLAGQPTLARPVGKAEKTWRWCLRNPWTARLRRRWQ